MINIDQKEFYEDTYEEQIYFVQVICHFLLLIKDKDEYVGRFEACQEALGTFSPSGLVL